MARQQINPVRTHNNDEPLFVTWNDDAGRRVALAEAGKALGRHSGVVMRAEGTNIFENIGQPNTSVRDGMSRRDYEYFRPGEARPRRVKDVIHDCNEVYRHVGLIHNIIDLMADFTVQGIEVVHPNKKIEQFCKAWWQKIEGGYVSERFANYLYRMANVVVKRTMAQLKQRDRENLEKGVADDGDAVIKPPKQIVKNRIPWKYNFINPLFIEVMAEDIATFVGDDSYSFALKISETLAKKIKNPSNATEKDLVQRIPSVMRQLVLQGARLVPLPMDQIDVYYYKKDDWLVWAEPMLFSILDDCKMLEKLKLADLAALDGAISHIRIWKLGSLDHKILPTAAAVQRLAEMLMNNVGGGSIDLIWGPDLELQETSTEISKFLGQEKYAPTLNAIYSGMGIPPTLTGSATQSGFTNNFISLKTLTERLNYGRSLLVQFWKKEFKLFQQAMGFRFPPELVFDRPVLTDEAAELALLVQLSDRGLISDESIQDRFGMLPSLEAIRIRRENQQRDDGKRAPKASPFHNPQNEDELKKIALSSGTVTPSEVGVGLEERAPGEKSLVEHQGDQQVKQAKVQLQGQRQQMDHDYRTQKLQLKHGVHPNQLPQNPKGVSGQGRPVGKKDNGPRKQKEVKPRSRAAAHFVANRAYAAKAQRALADILHPVFLAMSGKQNLRQLTDEEASSLEGLKFAVLCNTPIHAEIVEEKVLARLAEPLPIPAPILQMVEYTTGHFRQTYKVEPTLEDIRQIQSSVYALYHTPTDEDGVVPTEGEANGQTAA